MHAQALGKTFRTDKILFISLITDDNLNIFFCRKSEIMKRVFSLFIFLACILFFNCTTGLGPSPDLEGPEITITNPNEGDFLPKNFTISGTCKDNIKVTRVLIQERIQDEKIETITEAKIQGESWSAELSLEEGERTLICTAYDKAGNSSTKSQAKVSIIIDETAPNSTDWSIDRGGNKIISLKKDISELEQLDLSLSTNKFIPQNEKFTIFGKFTDSVSISKITIYLYENVENVENFIISKTLTAQDYSSVSENGSIYSPSWNFTESELFNAKSSLKSGKHYLKIAYEAIDNAGNKSNLIDVGYFLWYPESDIPGIEIKTENNQLRINTGSVIPLTFFDDDELEEVGYDLITEKDKNDKGITKDNLEYYISSEKKKILGMGYDEYQVQIPTKDGENVLPSGKYYLLAYTKEKKLENPIIKKEIVEVYLIDATKPTLIIENPTENEIPKVENGSKFTISGYSYDTSGSKYVKLVYIPGNESNSEKESRARILLSNDGIEKNPNEIIKKYEFATIGNKPQPKDGYVQESFEFEFDLINDFPTEKNVRKFFMLMVEDLDKNVEYKQLIVEADSEKPEFEIQEPKEMQVVDYSRKDLIFKFRATKSSGLGIDENSYKIKIDENPKEYTFSNGLEWCEEDNETHDFVTLTIPKEELETLAKSSSQQVFLFECSDILGNKSTERRTIVLSPLPVLEYVSVEQANGTYGIGKEIVFLAKFTDTVKITGIPRLKVLGITNNGNLVEKYANYVSGNNSDTIKFKYIVQDGDEAEKISCAGNKIDLNGGKIETGTTGEGEATIEYVNGKNFWEDESDDSVKKLIKLDGVKPTITDITAKVIGITPQNGKYYANSGRQILVTVTFSEAVLITANESLKINNKSFAQNSMGSDSKTAVYIYTAEENDNLEFLYNLADCFSNYENIKDVVGNTLLKGKNESKELNVIIDTKSPKIPVLEGINDGDIFNQKPKFKVLPDATDDDISKIEYSIDNGQTWNNYSDEVTISEGGIYYIKARVSDFAGNSATSETKNITFNDSFPDILEIAIDSPDGNYKFGDTLVFSVTLSDSVKAYDTEDATLSFEEFSTGNNKKIINIVANTTNDSNVLKFNYKVGEGDNFNGIHILSLSLSGIQDKYDNKQDSETTKKITELIKNETGACYRKNIKLDGDVPKISSRIPANGNAIKVDENGYLTIFLTFDEPVYKESGTITLQRKGNWGIPAVMTVDEFNKVYNSSALNESDKTKLKQIDGNTDKLDSKTGMPLGPYKKLTHGLKLQDEKYVPDIDTKYVLDFELGLFEGETSSTNVSVSDIREVFEKTGYHQHSLQIGSSQITTDDNKTWKIIFPEKIQEGIEWKLTISEGAFRDEVGNLYKDTSEYILWTDNVSAPVVRVDRYSHGYGAKEPDEKGELTEITVNGPAGEEIKDGSGGKIIPTGYVRVRVDTQTPGAKIKYQTLNKGVFNAITGQTIGTQAIPYSQYELKNGINEKKEPSDNYTFNDWFNSSRRCSVSEIPDLLSSDVIEIRPSESLPENHIIIIGDGEYKTARKDYVIAQASLDSVKNDNNQNMTNSSNEIEGAFKTVIYSKNYEGNAQFSIEGGTSNYGAPSVAGFPIKDGPGSPSAYSKNAYHIADNENIFVSYDFVSTNWSVLLREKNNSKNYGRSDYGQATYFCGFFHY